MPSGESERCDPNRDAGGIRPPEAPGSGRFTRWLRFAARLPALLVIALVQFYRMAVSPFLPPSCRFQPTCSVYMMDALRIHGFWRGLYLGTRRVFRCHPGNPGGFDPVPERRG
jgi:putative membrane protein insertion efficiency factor